MNVLTPDDLAALLKLPRRTVLETIVKQEDFPASVSGNRKPRWLEDAVLAWMRSMSASKTQTQ